MRRKFRKDLKDMLSYSKQEYLLLSNVEIRRIHAASKIKSSVVKHHRAKKKTSLEEVSCILIQKFFRGSQARKTSFIDVLELNKYPRLYFLKEQKPTFVKLIKSLMPILRKNDDLELDQLLECIKEDTEFDTIRVAEPDLFDYKPLPMVQLVKPSTMSKVRFSNSISKSHSLAPSFTLKDMYFSNDKYYTDQKLNTLKKRNCYLRGKKL